MSDPIVESTAVEVYDAPQAPTSLFGTSDPTEVIRRASEVAAQLKAVLVAQDLTVKIQNKDYVICEGWTLLGSMLGITAVCVETEPIENGFRATVEARTNDGRVVGRADAVCLRSEKRGPWRTAEDYALLSMAQTRATSKALRIPLGFIMSVAGYSTTPAEEITGGRGRRAAVTYSEPDIDALAGELLALADQLGKRAETAQAILKSEAENSLADHVAWMRRQIASAASKLEQVA